jgi:hypothetical protein
VEYALLTCDKEEPNTRADGAIGRAAQFQRLAPSASETLRFAVPVLIKNNRLALKEKQFSLDVTLVYSDGLHSGDVVEDSILCGPKPDKQGGGLVTLYYCVDNILSNRVPDAALR